MCLRRHRLGPGVYADAEERRIRVRAEHLPLVAERAQDVVQRRAHRRADVISAPASGVRRGRARRGRLDDVIRVIREARLDENEVVVEFFPASDSALVV